MQPCAYYQANLKAIAEMNCVDHSCASCVDCENYMNDLAEGREHTCLNLSSKLLPNREPAKDTEKPKPRLFDATDAEVAFWERVYASAATQYSRPEAVADRAVQERRVAFGKLDVDRTPYCCNQCGAENTTHFYPDLCERCQP